MPLLKRGCACNPPQFPGGVHTPVCLRVGRIENILGLVLEGDSEIHSCSLTFCKSSVMGICCIDNSGVPRLPVNYVIN